MDIVWMGALLALWVVVAAMVVALNRLEGSNPPKSGNGEAS
ncbi:hypothetical protein [Variovorax boronicumulans]|nr:hypothetical protein [Variovorax boronicumulans]MDQ0044184.1 hypothetical protein [Variovorax boronicumulans]